jgi:catechol 2,3-dioxygenase-like lactoylglutathione lyase family enzyme
MKGFHHVAVQITDLARAEAFYVGTLGLTVLRRWPAADGAERSLWLDVGGGSFLALERAAADSPTPGLRPFRDDHAGWHLVALAIDTKERGGWEERLAAAGVPIVHRTDYTLYVRDPDGNRIGLSHYPERGGS